MSTVEFQYGTLIQGRQNNMGTFDADLNPDVRNQRTNADLTLYVRIYFEQVNPTATSGTYQDSDNTAVPIRAWRADEWNQWKSRFLRDCQTRWHGKLWLRTPDSYSDLNYPEDTPTHRCNLYCRFRISEQSNANGAHAVIPVVRVDGNHFFRSHMLLYSNRDIRAERLTSGSRFYTHVHEIGHLIGLDHPGDALASCVNGNEDACYAAADGNDRGVMGRGSEVFPRHADPWKKAAAALTGVPEMRWVASVSRAYPTRL